MSFFKSDCLDFLILFFYIPFLVYLFIKHSFSLYVLYGIKNIKESDEREKYEEKRFVRLETKVGMNVAWPSQLCK